MDTPTLHEDQQWPYLLSLLPDDLEDSARQNRALLRCRNISDAAALMRMALAYAVSDLSLKDVAAWAHGLGVAEITGPGLFYRLRESEEWLEQVLAQTLQNQVKIEVGSKLKLRVVDAAVINGPGAKGAEWRAHVLINPGSGGFRAVELTDAHGGEGYGRHRLEAGEVILGDRAYATARGLHFIHRRGAYAVVRLNPFTLRVCDQHRNRVKIIEQECSVPKTGAVEFEYLIPVPPKTYTKSHRTWSLRNAVAWLRVRVVAARNKRGEVIWVIATLPRTVADATDVMELYRLRWQVELFFKRLKSQLHIDKLPSRKGPTAKSWILGRLIVAALAQKLVSPSGSFSPWGYNLRKAGTHR